MLDGGFGPGAELRSRLFIDHGDLVSATVRIKVYIEDQRRFSDANPVSLAQISPRMAHQLRVQTNWQSSGSKSETFS